MSDAPRNLYIDSKEKAARDLREWRRFIERQIRGQKRKRQALVERKRTLWELQKGLCWLCGEPLSKSFISRDHLHPKSKGGVGMPNNILLAHRTCNVKRGNRGIYTREQALAHLEQILSQTQRTFHVKHSTPHSDIVPKPL